MGLEVVFRITFREIALIGRKNILSRFSTIAGDSVYFTTADDIMKFLEIGLIGDIVQLEIEVLPLVATSIVKRVCRRHGCGTVEDSR